MQRPLKIIVVEDNQLDAELIIRSLRASGFVTDHRIVVDEGSLRTALAEKSWDVITSDHSMPGFDAPKALSAAHEIAPALPVIIVSGEIDVDLAVQLIKSGAFDYVRKKDLARLPVVIEKILREKELLPEKARLQRALEFSESKYQKLLSYSVDPIFILSREGCYLSVNDAFARVFGKTAAEIIGCNMRYLFDYEDSNHRMNALNEVFASRLQKTIEVEVPQQDQSIGYFCTKINPIKGKDGSFVAAFCVSRDITRQKKAEKVLRESEAQHRVLFESIADPVFLVDQSSGRIIDANPAASRIYGFAHADLIEMKAQDVSADPEETIKALEKPIPHVPLRFHRHKDGSVFPVDITSYTISLKGKNTIICTVRQI